MESNYNIQANLEYEVEVMARKHDTEYVDDEFESTTLYSCFGNVKEDNMKYALKETLKEVKKLRSNLKEKGGTLIILEYKQLSLN